MILDIRATIGEKRETVGYQGGGVSLVAPDGSAEPRELITFQTGNEDLAWLNNEIGVAFGKGEAGKLTVEVYLIRPG
jgi:ubiquinone biosynthesis protein COQ9